MKKISFFKKATVSMMFIMVFAVIPAISVTADSPQNSYASQPVFVIPVHQTIETGLQSFLERAFKEAEQADAAVIILDVNTLGGSIESAEGIGELIRSSPVETVAFIHGKAASAGSYISLNADQIVMQPGSSIGAAAVVDMAGNHVTDSKIVGHWASEMRSAAELNGRNKEIADGMVDEHIVVHMPEIGRTKEKGEIISLSAEEALKVGYAEKIAVDENEVLAYLDLQSHQVIHAGLSPAEKLARFLTAPWMMTILMVIGLAGIAIELFIPGFGLPGILGVAAFVLYFFGHYIAGFAGVEDVVLFVAGVALMIVELFVPSFGVFGIIGIICLFSGVVLAAYSTQHAIVSLGIALLIAIVVMAVVFKFFKHRGVWNRFILFAEQKNEEGYTSSSPKQFLLGQTGTAVSPLRPAGTALINDERVDVVTSGEFIAVGSPIKVSKVEGTRIVVRENTTKEDE